MPSKRFASPHDLLAHSLARCRREAKLTQEQLAERLGIGQSSVSKVERGLQRLDLVELRAWLEAIGGPSLVQFAQAFDERVAAGTHAWRNWRRNSTPTEPSDEPQGHP